MQLNYVQDAFVVISVELNTHDLALLGGIEDRSGLVSDQSLRSCVLRTEDRTTGLVLPIARTTDQTDCGPDPRPVLGPVRDQTPTSLG
jgi:hypothetical protein